MKPEVLDWQPQVLFPADSKLEPQAIHFLTRTLIGERPANFLAWFFSSISFRTDGGSFLTLVSLIVCSDTVINSETSMKKSS